MSGAKNCPETPRQRMIGMMYLVLTAMLALNVSSEILDGFSMVDGGLRESISSSDKRNAALYDDFQFMYEKNESKVKEWLDQANVVKQKSDEFYEYIKEFKYEILKIADGKKADKNAVKIISRENIDAAGEYALTKRNGAILRKNMDEYREFLKQINPSKADMYDTMFSTGGSSWETRLFESMPVSATITMLTKYQADIRSAEAEAVQYLKSRTDFDDFRVNQVKAFVVPNSRYIIQGGKYSADIILAATDSTRQYEYFVNNTRIPIAGDNKFGRYEFVASQTGTFKYSGVIRMPDNNGGTLSYPFTEEYTVGKPSATISNEDLNVVYLGIDNRFSVSVPGIAAENVHVKVDGGTAKKVSDGNFLVRATRDNEITIIVSALVEGREQEMGSSVFRVRYLPDPIAYLQYTDAGGVPRIIREGRISKRQLQSARIVASYGEDALVEAKFDVTSFLQLSIFGASTSNSGQLTSRHRTDIDQLEGGDIVTFKNIQAVGPDGKQRSLGVIQVEI